jgi:hypothetical protein
MQAQVDIPATLVMLLEENNGILFQQADGSLATIMGLT